jgi:acyl-homoserine lactone acylase PvdQ
MPTIDSVFISANGSYGYAPCGDLPTRNIPEMGSFIKDGNSDLYDFKEPVPFKEKPIIHDPKKGYFSMANNKFASNNYKHRSSLHQLTTGRSWILDKLIQ